MFDKQFLRNAMVAECLSMKALAEKSNVTLTTICLILNGKRNPSLATIGKLAKALNRNPADFFKE